MRQIARVLIFVLIFQSIGVEVMAQAVTAKPDASQQVAVVPNPAWPDRFGSDGEKTCIAALESEQYRIYVPENFDGTWRNPLDNKVHFRVWLNRDACVRMTIETGRMEWVPQKADTVFRATRVSGIVKVYARDDCGNGADAISYPPLKLTAGPKGDKGDPGKNAVVLPPTSTRSNKKWWWIGGAALAVAGGGYAYWYYSCVNCICPPGTVPAK